MEAPTEYLRLKLSVLKLLANSSGFSKRKKEAKKLIPEYEKAIEIINDSIINKK